MVEILEGAVSAVVEALEENIFAVVEALETTTDHSFHSFQNQLMIKKLQKIKKNYLTSSNYEIY